MKSWSYSLKIQSFYNKNSNARKIQSSNHKASDLICVKCRKPDGIKSKFPLLNKDNKEGTMWKRQLRKVKREVYDEENESLSCLFAHPMR